MSKTKNTEIVPTIKLSKKIQERLQAKMLDMNDEKIIELIQQINSHKQAIVRLNKEVENLTSIEGIYE